MSKLIQLIIVDDHPLIREGIKQILSFYPSLHIVGEGATGEEALALVKSTPCDLLLLDINMPCMNGIEVVRHLKQSPSSPKILMLTVENDFSTFKEAVDLQVDGYILKDSAGTTLIDAITHIYNGGNFIDQSLTKHVFHIVQDTSPEQDDAVLTPVSSDAPFDHLTAREQEVLFYISKGCSNKEIANKLFLSEKTIRNCITVLFKKIGVKDRVQATIFALKHNLQKPSSY